MVGIKIVEPHAEIITPRFWPDWKQGSLRMIEECGRVSHKSEGRIKADSAEPFIDKVALGMGHESIIEHANFTVCFVGSRSMSHQLVRHRLAAYTQASQRYCDYSSEKKFNDILQVIMPPTILGSKILWGKTVTVNGDNLVISGNDGKDAPLLSYLSERFSDEWARGGYDWCHDQIRSYQSYRRERVRGVPSEDARSHLTNACKTEVYTTYNLRTWRHVLEIRTDSHAQWEIRMIMNQALDFFMEHVPFMFDDIGKRVTFRPKELRVLQDLFNSCYIQLSGKSHKDLGLSKTEFKTLEKKISKAVVAAGECRWPGPF